MAMRSWPATCDGKGDGRHANQCRCQRRACQATGNSAWQQHVSSLCMQAASKGPAGSLAQQACSDEVRRVAGSNAEVASSSSWLRGPGAPR